MELQFQASSDQPDLIMLLLAGAVQASHAVERLEQLAAINPQDDPVAAANVAAAIASMNGVKVQLVSYADYLATRKQTFRS